MCAALLTPRLALLQWLWSGHHGQIPFIGRSRFDPRTLHGPWMELSATQVRRQGWPARLYLPHGLALSCFISVWYRRPVCCGLAVLWMSEGSLFGGTTSTGGCGCTVESRWLWLCG